MHQLSERAPFLRHKLNHSDTRHNRDDTNVAPHWSKFGVNAEDRARSRLNNEFKSLRIHDCWRSSGYKAYEPSAIF